MYFARALRTYVIFRDQNAVAYLMSRRRRLVHVHAHTQNANLLKCLFTTPNNGTCGTRYLTQFAQKLVMCEAKESLSSKMYKKYPESIHLSFEV